MNSSEMTFSIVKSEFKEIFITQLIRGKHQPRREFDSEGIQELANTIKAVGILQYLLVRPIVEKENLFEIIAGERRWRAAQIAGLEKVPCLICDYSEETSAQIALIENTARRDLSSIEEASAIEKLITEFGYTHEEVAKILGKPRTQVTNLLRLLKLDSRVHILLTKGDLTESHGKILAGVPKSEQFKLAKDTIVKKWSVHRLEQVIKKQEKETAAVTASANAPVAESNPHLERLRRKFSEYVAAPVLFDFDDKAQQSGYIKIRFASLDEFEGVLERVGYRDE